MNDFLNSLKADLLDRRLLPILALVGVGLVAAVAYAVLGGGGSTSPVTPSARGTAARVPAGIAVSEAPVKPDQAVAETTSGSSSQRRGYSHDPFNPLHSAVKAAAASTATSTTKSSSSTTTKSGGSSTGGTTPGSGTSSKGEPAPVAPSKPSTPKKPATVYDVSVLFGVVPAGTPPQPAQLTPHQNLKLLTPLPSGEAPLIVFRGVTAGGKSASFTLVGEAILRGDATCLPSAAQCQEIDMKVGQGEQLEYLPPNGQPITYELRVSTIASRKASSAAVSRMLRGTSKVGGALLSRAGLVAMPGLRYSSVVGVLTFGNDPASAARAHA